MKNFFRLNYSLIFLLFISLFSICSCYNPGNSSGEKCKYRTYTPSINGFVLNEKTGIVGWNFTYSDNGSKSKLGTLLTETINVYSFYDKPGENFTLEGLTPSCWWKFKPCIVREYFDKNGEWNSTSYDIEGYEGDISASISFARYVIEHNGYQLISPLASLNVDARGGYLVFEKKVSNFKTGKQVSSTIIGITENKIYESSISQYLIPKSGADSSAYTETSFSSDVSNILIKNLYKHYFYWDISSSYVNSYGYNYYVYPYRFGANLDYGFIIDELFDENRKLTEINDKSIDDDNSSGYIKKACCLLKDNHYEGCRNLKGVEFNFLNSRIADLELTNLADNKFDGLTFYLSFENQLQQPVFLVVTKKINNVEKAVEIKFFGSGWEPNVGRLFNIPLIHVK